MITYVLFASVIIVGLIFQRSRIASAYILSALYLLAAFNYMNADYVSYTMSYQQTSAAVFEYRYIGYSFFIHFFGSRGFSYSMYLKVVFVLLIAIMFIAIRLLTDKPNAVLALFAIFPFAMDVVQVKAFYSEALAFLAVAILIRIMSENETVKINLKLIAALGIGILSVLFHFSSIYYLIAGAMFCLIKDRKKLNSRVFIASVVTLFIIYTGCLSVILKVFNKIGLISNMGYLERYFEKSTRFGFLVTFVGVFLIIGACLLSEEPEDTSDPVMKRQSLLRSFILTIYMVLPLLMVNISFDRLVRVYMMLMYIFFVNQPKTIDVNLKKTLSYVMFIGSIVFFFVFDIYSFYEGTLKAILDYSELYGLLY